MSDADDALAATAVGLNEDAKASRKKKAAETPPADPPVVEQRHTTAIERMENMAMEADFVNSETLVSDVRDFLLDQIKHRPKPWSAMNADEQRDVAAVCDTAAVELVRKVIEEMASRGVADPVRVLLTKFTDGEDIVITGKVKTYDDDEKLRAIMLLHKQRGKHVMVTAATVEDYQGAGRDPEIDPDEPGLDFAAGARGDDELSDAADQQQGDDD